MSRRFLGAASEYAVPGSSSPRTKSPKSGPSASLSLNAAIASDCAADDDVAEEDERRVHAGSLGVAEAPWVTARGDAASARENAPDERRAAAMMSADIVRACGRARSGLDRVRRAHRSLPRVVARERVIPGFIFALEKRPTETGRTCTWRFHFSAPVTRDERLLGSVPSLGARRAASGSRRVQDRLIRRRYRGCAAGGQGCRSLLAPLRQHASLSSSAHLGGTRQPLSQRAAAREQGAGAG